MLDKIVSFANNLAGTSIFEYGDEKNFFLRKLYGHRKGEKEFDIDHLDYDSGRTAPILPADVVVCHFHFDNVKPSYIKDEIAFIKSKAVKGILLTMKQHDNDKHGLIINELEQGGWLVNVQNDKDGVTIWATNART